MLNIYIFCIWYYFYAVLFSLLFSKRDLISHAQYLKIYFAFFVIVWMVSCFVFCKLRMSMTKNIFPFYVLIISLLFVVGQINSSTERLTRNITPAYCWTISKEVIVFRKWSERTLTWSQVKVKSRCESLTGKQTTDRCPRFTFPRGIWPVLFRTKYLRNILVKQSLSCLEFSLGDYLACFAVTSSLV